MANIVIKVTPSTIEKMKNHYQNNLLNKNIPYTNFVAQKNGVTITAYTSGKVMFQGNQAQKEAAQWETGQKAVSKQTTKKQNESQLPEGFDKLTVIGSDEVGNGSYFGPVTVCAAFVDQDHLAPLKAIGVRDSKELTDPQIRQMAEEIKKLIPYQLLIVNPQKYNQIQPNYNAVRMKVALHNQAILLLLNKIAPVKPDAILIDQFTPETNYRKYLQMESQQVPGKIYFKTKGEQYHLAVAAASIISRASFLEELEAASQELGFTVPSGAGSKSDQVAARILQEGGLDLLGNYAKLHFANTQKAQTLLR